MQVCPSKGQAAVSRRILHSVGDNADRIAARSLIVARSKPEEVRRWLEGKPSLDELRDAYPADWEVVERDLADVVSSGDTEQLKAYVESLARGASRGTREPEPVRVRAELRRRMAATAIEQLSLAAAAGVQTGDRIRFNLLNGFAAQKLLFKHDLERKPVSLPWFRIVWPLLWQRRFLMPLVGPKGIYCFYSKPLIAALAELIGNRSCLEIAAGDGTLTRFLRDVGTNIVATDDHSWSHSVRYADVVAKEEASVALRRRQPQVVVCSWPPAGNRFERHVFETSSVELYVMIGSRHLFAAGNWQDYEHQSRFEFAEYPRLSRLVLPPELDAAVYVFRRKDPAS